MGTSAARRQPVRKAMFLHSVHVLQHIIPFGYKQIWMNVFLSPFLIFFSCYTTFISPQWMLFSVCILHESFSFLLCCDLCVYMGIMEILQRLKAIKNRESSLSANGQGQKNTAGAVSAIVRFLTCKKPRTRIQGLGGNHFLFVCYAGSRITCIIERSLSINIFYFLLILGFV